MPLFMCSTCGVADNTAVSGYWQQQHAALEKKAEFKPLCSEHFFGAWHGRFPKNLVAGWFVDASGFVWRESELAKVPANLGPFTPAVLPEGVISLAKLSWFCACGWTGQAADLKPTPGGATSGLACPSCGATGGLASKEEAANG